MLQIKHLLFPAFVLKACLLWAQLEVPAVYGNLFVDSTGVLRGKDAAGNTFGLYRKEALFTLSGVTPKVSGDPNGLRFHFASKKLRGGQLTYGLIPYGQHTYPTAVLRFTASIDSLGNAFLALRKDLTDGLDHTGWKKSGFGTIGYRLTDAEGLMVYEGKQAFAVAGSNLEPRPTVVRGPFVSLQTHNSVVLWYETSSPVQTRIQTNLTAEFSKQPTKRHVVELLDLQPNTAYNYTVECDSAKLSFRFRTAPVPGNREPFTFAYASDSRSGYGGGERNVYGANAQIMQRIGALSCHEKAAFVQFTGDLANGYVSDPDELRLQLTNWIHAVEPYWHYLPFNVGMGNHESLGWASELNNWVVIDGFPYETHSGEALIAQTFVNPTNGPVSEDDTPYDPNPGIPGDFPTYSENVFYYTYGNVAMVVLNTDYWYAPGLKRNPSLNGNLHGYIMDAQLQWLKTTLAMFENDPNIDHVFITLHTPPFPNGGHRHDCMWYDGDNTNRPWVAGKPVNQGIIERRDALLDLCANRSSKVIGFLCGDEHNYNRMVVDENTPRYPVGWDKPRVVLKRPLWQIINGAAGAPFYGQQKLPWSASVKGFTVQNALCLFDVTGKKIVLRVINPDTLEEIDRTTIR